MKKMIKQALALTAVLMMTAAAQAAAINWSAPVNAMLDSEGAVLSGAVVLLVQTANGAGAPTIGWDSGLTISGGNYLGQTTLNASGKISPAAAVSITGSWSSGNINVLGGAAYGEPSTVATEGFGNTHGLDYYMVVFDSASISASSQFAMVSLSNKYATTDTGNLTLTYGTTAATTTGISSTWTEVDPIPEPATAGLLALGLVAIALRRRMKK